MGKVYSSNKKMDQDSHGFGHMFYKKQSGGSISAITNLLLPLMYQACDKINFTFTELYWGRVFLTFPTVHDIFQKKHKFTKTLNCSESHDDNVRVICVWI